MTDIELKCENCGKESEGYPVYWVIAGKHIWCPNCSKKIDSMKYIRDIDDPNWKMP